MKMRGQKAASRTKNKHAHVGDYKKAQQARDLTLHVQKLEKAPDLTLPVKKAQQALDLTFPVKKARADENHKRRSVPQFEGRDQVATGSTNYSVIFAQARANRKQHKSNLNRVSLGCEKEPIATYAHGHKKEDPIVRMNKILSYLNCCMGV
ncbi:hypothetical protein SAY86_031732 [Trapa natans]|uniref:Uncharacterized protein n=1 Tax=Trapa natans TaxID=22666 RepID=A0AAN7LTA5_TRANT|nr:hypothetical protein SAY86_031732 [Trapa natans]